jgi:hypothetical protein
MAFDFWVAKSNREASLYLHLNGALHGTRHPGSGSPNLSPDAAAREVLLERVTHGLEAAIDVSCNDG